MKKTESQPNTLNVEKILRDKAGCHKYQAIDFHDGKSWDVWLETSTALYRARKMGEWQAKEIAFTIPEVLIKPKRIFQGVREDGEAEWLCYCGIPSRAYNKFGERKPYENQVFLIFVNHDRLIYNWRWEQCCPDDCLSPINHANRFHKKVLP